MGWLYFHMSKPSQSTSSLLHIFVEIDVTLTYLKLDSLFYQHIYNIHIKDGHGAGLEWVQPNLDPDSSIIF